LILFIVTRKGAWAEIHGFQRKDKERIPEELGVEAILAIH
jgi:N-acetylglutamate synthase-like GNAT family acetyltransferase